MILHENINSYSASLIIEELVRNGVELFCISPGSRSTPLTVAAARHARAQSLVCHDERGAAFMALGYGKATGRPAALICTSGTAAANYYPAVIEASMDDTPLLLLTADRPPELLDAGANQTIFQEHLYGAYTRWSVVLPPPSEDISPQFILTTVDQAVHRSIADAGPVHLNCRFREPLAPTPQAFTIPDNSRLQQWETDTAPFTSYRKSTATCREQDINRIAEILHSAKNGLVILGRRRADVQRQSEVHRFLQRLGWPVHADIASGFRLGDRAWPIADELAMSADFFRHDSSPDVVLHLGGAFISKKLQQHLETASVEHYILVNENPRRIDPGQIVSERLQCDIADFCAALNERILPRQNAGKPDAHRIHRMLDEQTPSHGLSEPLVARLLSKKLPAGHGLFLGNSMPVRDMNTFAVYDGGAAPVGANRGASGIDGTIASAIGFARGLNAPTTLLIGDVAFLHDLNSLNMLQHSPQPLTVVCINNNGGGIFSHLPIAEHADVFEPYFITPHGLSFGRTAALFGLACEQPETVEAFVDALKKAWSAEASTIIEIKIERQKSAALRRELLHGMKSGDAAS